MDVHITEMVNAFRLSGHEVLIAGPETHHTTEFGKGGEASDFLRKLLPKWCGEILELVYDKWIAFPRLEKACRSFQPDVLYERNNSQSVTQITRLQTARKPSCPRLLI